MTEHTLKIVDGKVEFVYDDALATLLEQGDSKVVRASHVEPHPTKVGWLADMRPSGGPVIGKGRELPESVIAVSGMGAFDMIEGFALREEALAAEREWLSRERGL